MPRRLKANFSFLKGTDWWATDYNQYTQSAVGQENDITTFNASDPGFDALNRYGDEVATTLNYDEILGVPAGTFGSSYVARTGYNEVDLMDYDARNVKADFALHYKPWGDDKEVIFNYRVGKGSTIYQGANRYSLDNMIMNQIKLEFKGKNFFIRGYRTTEDAADASQETFLRMVRHNGAICLKSPESYLHDALSISNTFSIDLRNTSWLLLIAPRGVFIS